MALSCLVPKRSLKIGRHAGKAAAIGTDDKEHKTFKDKGRGGGTEGEESQDLKGKKENVCYRAAPAGQKWWTKGCVRRRS